MKHTQAKSKTKEQLESEIRTLSVQWNKIKDKEDAAIDASFLGRFFKTRNNYSCPKKPSDYWWLYAKVVCVKSGIKATSFQVDCNGRIEIRQNDYFMSNTLLSYTEISQLQYEKAWLKCLEQISAAINKTATKQ